MHSSSAPHLRRKCGCGTSSTGGAECSECSRKRLQRKPAGNPRPGSAPPVVHEVLSSPGLPLDNPTRNMFEPRFGRDFGRVRIHTDEKAAGSASAVNALAYTVGNHVVFASGQYRPAAPLGQKLLAHELAHVLQQQDIALDTGSLSGLEVGAPDDTAEYEAEAAAQRIVLDPGSDLRLAARAAPAGRVAPQLRRDPDDEPKKYHKPLIQWGDYDVDVKPNIPGPISAPSLEDVRGALGQGTANEKPNDLKCPPGWRKIKDGRCCEGERSGGATTVRTERPCCPPVRLTNTGMCCPPGQTAEGTECKPNEVPPLPVGKGSVRLKLPPATPPLTFDLMIHFNQDQPASVVASEGALRSSLTSIGQTELGGVVQWLTSERRFSAQLTGMASEEGPAEHNSKLAEFRAQSVANLLVLSGINRERISDPPGLPVDCREIAPGIRNCGAAKASSPTDANDRQVRVRVFIPPRRTVTDTRAP
jgi:hypothetical protein